MRFSSEVRIALIGAFILLVPSQAVLALSGPEVNVIAKGITVRIDGKNTGSGVIINRQGNTYVVLTNWHVVNAAGTYIVQTSDGRRYSVNSSLVKRQPAVDLAVLQFTSSQSYRVAELGNSDSLTEGIKVYVAGWADPGPLIPERSYQFLTGYISSRLQRPKDGYSLVYTINAVPGMSGGPVLDDRGYVVGINGRAIPDLRTGTVSFVLGIGINTYLRAGNNVEMVRGSLPPAVRSLSAVNFFSRGVDKAERGDYQGAIADYNQALQLNPNFAEAYNNRGLARYKQGGIAGA
ncbi:MAG: trypsin-like peptidase domain-containing protein, partial [Aphanothece sp. CMT-3BRIN-NPC111]|nr:trypsin-like peptidase domain-containing protein [Aphanothece sp. CMT-3BRIN-NPC111]